MRRRLRTLSGISALVTGASSGIGRSLALELARQGANVGLVSRSEDKLEELRTSIAEAGGQSIAMPCDITQPSQLEEVAAQAATRLDGVDLLVHCGGIGGRSKFLDSSAEDFERMLSVNLLGAVNLTRLLLPSMVARGRGWLVFMASAAGRIPTVHETAYVSSKFALVGFAESLSLEVEDSGVHVLVVCPGIVDTPFFGETGPPRLDGPFTQPVDPADVAESVLDALAKGRRSLTVPRGIAGAYVARALAPEWTRRQSKRASEALPLDNASDMDS